MTHRMPRRGSHHGPLDDCRCVMHDARPTGPRGSMSDTRGGTIHDTRPLVKELLSKEQTDFVGGIVARVEALAVEKPRRPQPRSPSGWSLELEPDRSYRALLIDGGRGTGKTSLMLTALRELYERPAPWSPPGRSRRPSRSAPTTRCSSRPVWPMSTPTPGPRSSTPPSRPTRRRNWLEQAARNGWRGRFTLPDGVDDRARAGHR